MIFRLLSRNNATCCSVAIVGDGVRISCPLRIESRSSIAGVESSDCIIRPAPIRLGVPPSKSVPGADQASRVRRDSQVNPMGFSLSCWDRPAGRSVAIVGDGVRISCPLRIESRSSIAGVESSDCIIRPAPIRLGVPPSKSVPGADQASRVRRDSQVNPMGFSLSCWDRPAGRSVAIVGDGVRISCPLRIESRSCIDGIGVSSCIVSTSTI
jgi:hypothetical protein